MKRVAVINVVGLTSGLIDERMPLVEAFKDRNRLATVRPAFPAVTCTAQSDYVTGKRPSEHGIVGNGWFDRDYSETLFWKQSNKLVEQPKIWDELRELAPGFTCAKLFWWYNMYSSADYSITPRPMYPADGRKFFDVYTQPMGMREDIKEAIGEFPFPAFWGPRAGIDSSKWIADSAKWVEAQHEPTLNLVYLPHLDYNLQRLGPSDPGIAKDLGEIDSVVGDLIEFFEGRGIEVLLLSEYGISEVDRAVHLNRIFREKGWITIKDELGLEQLDCGASKVFAVADHQVAHVYVNDDTVRDEARRVLEGTEGVESVWGEEEKRAAGMDHERAGDFVVTSDERSWFTYYYWLDDAVAPDFARCVDIHRKVGYDPVELFIDPDLKFPMLKVVTFLLKKKFGFRGLLDVIPLDATLVKGSHGRIPDDRREWPVLIGKSIEESSVESTDVYTAIKAAVLG